MYSLRWFLTPAIASFGVILLSQFPTIAQNQSDVTGPNVDPPLNQSDITGPQPIEISPIDLIEPLETEEPNNIIDETPPVDDAIVDNPNQQQPQNNSTPNNPIDTVPVDNDSDSPGLPVSDGNVVPENPTDFSENPQNNSGEPSIADSTTTTENSSENIDNIDRNNSVHVETFQPIEASILDAFFGDENTELEVDRQRYENLVAQSDIPTTLQLFEEFYALEFSNFLGIELFGKVAQVDEIAAKLYEMWQVTGKKAAFLYISSYEDRLELLLIPPVPPLDGSEITPVSRLKTIPKQQPTIAQGYLEEVISHSERHVIPNLSSEIVSKEIGLFQNAITDPRKRGSSQYLPHAQQLYQWFVDPVNVSLQEKEIDILVLAVNQGLRSVPFSALHDGDRFLIEKYALTLVPSFGLTDISFVDFRNSPILAMGASEFSELNDLPAVPLELEEIANSGLPTDAFLNEGFTVENFLQQNENKQYRGIHIATHAEFRPGALSNSYIYFYNNKIGLDRLRKITDRLGWNLTTTPAIELLTLSACRTALGDPQAELGFAGLAVLYGAKSALASLWYVSDEGTLGLMGEFYNHLQNNPLKSIALQEAQLAMLRGETYSENGLLHFSNGQTTAWEDETKSQQKFDYSHPYYWSAFSLIGNWN